MKHLSPELESVAVQIYSWSFEIVGSSLYGDSLCLLKPVLSVKLVNSVYDLLHV